MGGGLETQRGWRTFEGSSRRETVGRGRRGGATQPQSVSQSVSVRGGERRGSRSSSGGQLVAGGEEGVKLLGGGEARGDRVGGGKHAGSLVERLESVELGCLVAETERERSPSVSKSENMESS